MAEVNQYSISLEEMIKLIIKDSNVHEGQWGLAVGMMIGTGNFPSPSNPDQSFPGASMMINQLGIQRIPPGTPVAPGSAVVDAAKVNPKKGK